MTQPAIPLWVAVSVYKGIANATTCKICGSVRPPVGGVGNALPKSKTEREISRRASLAQTSRVVLLARR